MLFRSVDDSMEPEFPKGCIIIVDPTGHARDGAFVLAEVDGTYIFRRLVVDASQYTLAPLNAQYPSLTLADGLEAVRGVIVQRAGTRRRLHKRYE